MALPRYDDLHIGTNLRDIAVNIIGFVPFGFFVFCFRRIKSPERSVRNVLFAVAAGAALSLAIELIQVWLPQRSSAVTDIAFNTLGAILGVMLAVLVRSGTTTSDTRNP